LVKKGERTSMARAFIHSENARGEKKGIRKKTSRKARAKKGSANNGVHKNGRKG